MTLGSQSVHRFVPLLLLCLLGGAALAAGTAAGGATLAASVQTTSSSARPAPATLVSSATLVRQNPVTTGTTITTTTTPTLAAPATARITQTTASLTSASRAFATRPAATVTTITTTTRPRPTPRPMGQGTTLTLALPGATGAPRIETQLYGQFVENIGYAFPEGLSANKLRGRGFEGTGFAEHWKFIKDDGADGIPTLTTGTAVNGRRSVRLEFARGAIGIRQERVSLKKDENYVAVIWARLQVGAPRLLVRVRDSAGRLVVESPFPTTGTLWREYRTTFTCPIEDNRAAIEFVAAGRGTLDLDYVTLMREREARAGGLRADILDAVKALQPAFIRFPGGGFASDYDWRNGVGPAVKRPYLPGPWKFSDDNEIGTDEFMELCRQSGADPLIVLNARPRGRTGQGTSEGAEIASKGGKAGKSASRESAVSLLTNALNWIQYLTGSTESKMGRQRAANGHPEPYRVPYFQIDNEPMNYGLDGAAYAAIVNQWGPRLRQAAPKAKIIACGQKRDFDMKFSREVIEKACANFDILGVHNYEYDDKEAVGGVRRIEKYLAELQGIIKKSKHPALKIGVLEWGMAHGHASMDWRSGIHAAGMLMLYERMSPAVTMSSPAVFIRRQGDKVWGYGASIMFNDATWWPSGAYAVGKLFREHYAPLRLTSTTGPIDAIATASEDGTRLVIKAANYQDAPAALTLRFAPGQAFEKAEVKGWAIEADPRTETSPERPDLFKPREWTQPYQPVMTIELKPWAVAVVEIRKQ